MYVCVYICVTPDLGQLSTCCRVPHSSPFMIYIPPSILYMYTYLKIIATSCKKIYSTQYTLYDCIFFFLFKKNTLSQSIIGIVRKYIHEKKKK